MKGSDDMISTIEGKEIDIKESIEEMNIKIYELEQRKKYLEGRLHEVQNTLVTWLYERAMAQDEVHKYIEELEEKPKPLIKFENNILM